jgi:hypothetical protein
MTATSDSDRIIRAWLDLMPDEAPEHAIASVLQAVAEAPQPRRARWWPTWRSTPMNRTLVALGAAAIVAVVAGAVLLGRPATLPSVGASPTVIPSTPSAAASFAPAASEIAVGGPVPSELVGRWMGGHTSFVEAGAGSSLVVSQNGIAIEQANQNGHALLGAAASAPNAGQLRVETTGQPGCRPGDVGIYGWTRSSGGRVLTLTAVSDDCAARSAAVAGTWWQMGCRNPNTDCLGDLEPGTYATQYIAPRLATGTPWSPLFGGITYTVPVGWANSQDWPSTIKLTPSADYALETASGPPNGVLHEIYVFTEPAADTQDGTCPDKPDASVAHTVDGLLTWLARQPALATTTPTPITIDGHPGAMIDISLRPSWTRACPGDSSPSAAILTPAGSPLDPWGVGIRTGEHDRLILLDLGDGHLLGITVVDHHAKGQPDRFQALVNASMPVIQSFRFK